jgi:hypothetical protein
LPKAGRRFDLRRVKAGVMSSLDGFLPLGSHAIMAA